MSQAGRIFEDVLAIRERAPLIHNITNYVVTNTTANALLALGASPAMTHEPEEAADFARIAGALVINMGSLHGSYVDAMILAGRAAREAGVPLVFDPCAAGASRYRNEVAPRLMALHPAIVRGNASEILALAGTGFVPKGVDSTHGVEAAMEPARDVARRHNCVVVVSGEADAVTDGTRVALVRNGHPMMPKVTGLGCTATAICGAFAAVNPDYFAAALHGMAVMGVAGEMAAEKSPGPGSLQMHFYDALYLLNQDDLSSRLKLELP